MVRFKNRWLLVKVELADDIRNNKAQPPSIGWNSASFPSKSEFVARLRRTVAWCFGIAGEAPSYATQIKFYDPDTQLVVVRVPRQYCDTIRSALTLLLTRKQLVSLGDTLDATTTAQDYYASVVSVHGSARTAKMAVYRKLRELYRIELQESRRRFPDDEKLAKKLCRGLQERLALVQNHLN